MYRILASEECVEYLRGQAVSLENHHGMIHDSTVELLRYIELQKDTLGPHLYDIRSALTHVLGASEKSDEALRDMSDMLRTIADRLEEIIDSDIFSKANLPET